MKVKKSALAALLLAASLSLTSCGLISVKEIEVTHFPAGAEQGEKAQPVSAAAFAPESESEKRRTAAAEAISAFVTDTYDGGIVFTALPEESAQFPEECASVLDRMTVTRNALVEEMLDVRLVTHRMTADEIAENAKRQKKAGETVDDILVLDAGHAVSLSLCGALSDLTKIDGYRAEAFDVQSSLGSSEGVYYAVGDASFDVRSYRAVLFGKQLLERAGIDCGELYSAAEDNTLTWDKLLGYREAVPDALFVTPDSAVMLAGTVYKSAGLDYLTKNGGKLTAAFDYDTLTAFDDLFSRIREAGIVTSSETSSDDFVAGKTVFLIHKLSAIPRLGGSTETGVLPLPCAEEGQGRVTAHQSGVSVFAVAEGAQSAKAALSVITALNAAHTPTVGEGYIEYLAENFLSDDGSRTMLSLILSSGKTDGAYILGTRIPECLTATVKLTEKHPTDKKAFDKELKASVTAMQKAIEKAVKNANNAKTKK